MKLKAMLLALALSTTLAFAQTSNELRLQNDANDVTLVTLQSKGLDVRAVLHELFTQTKRSYVIENVPRVELFLNLDSVEFEEALALIARIARLSYEQQNGIYFVRQTPRVGTGTTPTTQSAQANPTSRPEQPKVAPSAPAGKLPESVLNRRIKGSYTKQALSKILEDFGQQTQVKIEIDPKVPKYHLDLTLNTTSLGWALRRLAQELKLELVFTERQSLLLRPAR